VGQEFRIEAEDAAGIVPGFSYVIPGFGHMSIDQVEQELLNLPVSYLGFNRYSSSGSHFSRFPKYSVDEWLLEYTSH
jgi:hypothetical protein